MSGCAGGSAVVAAVMGPSPTKVTGQLAASPDLNPDAKRRASPVFIRFYELKAIASFSAADFMALFQKDQEILGGDIVAREEWILQPGEQRKLDRTLGEATRHLALFAAYRDVEHARWRVSCAVRTGVTQAIVARAEALAVSLATAEGGGK